MQNEVWACYHLNGEIREQSSSGGIYGLLAKHILDAGGVVFAVCWDENFETVHRKIEKAEDLPQTYGAKYVPSELGDTFRSVRDCLQKGATVLFAGTPCQAEGLRMFLGRDYENLYLVDFVCHGVPSRAAWRKYLEAHQLKGKLLSLNMRDKSSGWSRYRYSWNIATEDGKQICVPQSQVSFMKGFVSDIYLRPSCYECRFKGVERRTDLTLGDFWGVWDEMPEIDDDRGISAVLIHSEKGKALFESAKNEMCCWEVSANAVVQHNPSIVNSAKLTKNRDRFFRELNSGKDFDALVESLCSTDSRVGRWKQLAKKILRNI